MYPSETHDPTIHFTNDEMYFADKNLKKLFEDLRIIHHFTTIEHP